MAQIRSITTDIFTSDAQVIVNPVNCRGVMGAGLALAFKEKYPEMFTAYVEACQRGELRIGQLMLYRASQPWILNFPTKNHWRSPSKLIYIDEGLHFFAAHYQQMGIQSIAFPKLGCGHGNLSWAEVGPLMVNYLSPLTCKVTLHIDEGDTTYSTMG